MVAIAKHIPEQMLAFLSKLTLCLTGKPEVIAALVYHNFGNANSGDIEICRFIFARYSLVVADKNHTYSIQTFLLQCSACDNTHCG